MRNLIIAALIVLSAACGAAGPGTGSHPSPTPLPSGRGFDVTATEKDSAVAMRVGQRLEVVLHGGTGMRYQQVGPSDQSILAPTVDPAETAAVDVTIAAFVAMRTGTTEVTAVGTAVCPSGHACPMFALLYRLTVTVTP